MQGKFIVPQFIDSEDKILGPITVRQFVIMIVGGLFIFLSYKLSDMGLFIFQTAIIVIIVIAFAFLKVNGSAFHIFALNFIEAFKRPRVRTWRKEHIRVEEFKTKGEDEEPVDEYVVRKSFLSDKKLSELSLIIDTGGVYKGEQEVNKLNNVTYHP